MLKKKFFLGSFFYSKTCKSIGCVEDVFCKRLCVHHYHKERREKQEHVSCSEQDCNKKIWKSKLCRFHYGKSSNVKVCSISGCAKKSVHNRKCEIHINENQPIICSHVGCNIPIITFKSNLCSSHYHQKRRNAENVYRKRRKTEIYCSEKKESDSDSDSDLYPNKDFQFI